MRTRWTIAFAAVLALLAQGCAGSGASATHLASSATRPASSATAPIANASITPLPRPSLGAPSLKAPGWEGVVVRTICLDMRLSLTDPAVEGAVEQGLMDTLEGLGITTVEVGGSCEATIAVALTGKALSAQYKDLGWCYTGAEISGTVSLLGSGRSPYPIGRRSGADGPVPGEQLPQDPTGIQPVHVVRPGDLRTRRVTYGIRPLWPRNPTPNRFDWSLPTFSVLMGGRTSTMGYLSWCKPLAAAS